MNGRRFTDEVFDEFVTGWIDDRAQGPSAEPVLARVLSITTGMRPRPAWRTRERWLPTRAGTGAGPILRPAAILVLIALLVIAAVAILAVGSGRRLPPPFGLAAPGDVAFIADGHVWTANGDGSGLHQVTFDPRTDGFPTFSRDGTRIAFKRLPVPNSKSDWQAWGDIVVANVDGGHPIVLDRDVHSPSPMSWSADGRFVMPSGSPRLRLLSPPPQLSRARHSQPAGSTPAPSRSRSTSSIRVPATPAGSP
jgi:hypothetical protein